MQIRKLRALDAFGRAKLRPYMASSNETL
jgi:hypothetical protein